VIWVVAVITDLAAIVFESLAGVYKVLQNCLIFGIFGGNPCLVKLETDFVCDFFEADCCRLPLLLLEVV
jgi:hypothetical protein